MHRSQRRSRSRSRDRARQHNRSRSRSRGHFSRRASPEINRRRSPIHQRRYSLSPERRHGRRSPEKRRKRTPEHRRGTSQSRRTAITSDVSRERRASGSERKRSSSSSSSSNSSNVSSSSSRSKSRPPKSATGFSDVGDPTQSTCGRAVLPTVLLPVSVYANEGGGGERTSTASTGSSNTWQDVVGGLGSIAARYGGSMSSATAVNAVNDSKWDAAGEAGDRRMTMDAWIEQVSLVGW